MLALWSLQNIKCRLAASLAYLLNFGIVLVGRYEVIYIMYS